MSPNKELITIVDNSIPYPGPTINTTYFPNTYADGYWSSTTRAFHMSIAWGMAFNYGGTGTATKSDGNYVRCVRGGQSSSSFTNNGNGTITDSSTSLMWQQGEPGSKTWANALTYCEGLSLGGQSDWRLPNIKELDSIANDTFASPAIDSTYFPNAFASHYWSSTTRPDSTNSVLVVGFGTGGPDPIKSNSLYVRCVRGGQSGSLCNLTISPSSQTVTSAAGTGSVTVTASGSSCAWTASSTLSWVTITSGSSGTGSGTVTISVAANTTGATRTGNITIAGQTFIITQSATTPTCTYTISPTSQTSTSTGGTRSITVTPSSTSCTWTATSSLSWATITSGSSGTGSGTVTISVAANTTGAARTGNITIAGKTFMITQSDSVFADVASTNVFYSYINAIYNNNPPITVGCSQNPLMYCPDASVTRGQMAAFIIRAKYGENSTYTLTPYFSDVPATNGFFKYVQKMKDTGITAVTGTYGVNDTVTRGQMAAFIIRAKYGETFTYTQTPYFSDVPATNVFFKYVQKMKDANITAVTGTYNVNDTVTRGAMAAFIARAFLNMP